MRQRIQLTDTNRPIAWSGVDIKDILFGRSGGYSEEATPVPIPNTAVKLLSADDTWWVTARENRTPPVLEISS